jgi:hypothetical protein
MNTTIFEMQVKLIFQILFFGTLTSVLVAATTVCDCQNKKQALIDLSVPEYCNHKEEYINDKPKWVNYEIVSKKKPPFVFDALMMCTSSTLE